MTHKGKAAVVEDAFADGKSPKGTPRGSGENTPIRSRVTSAAPTPAGSGTEGTAPPMPVVKKKKPTRNQMKAREERRRIRHLDWLAKGGAKPEDTDSD